MSPLDYSNARPQDSCVAVALSEPCPSFPDCPCGRKGAIPDPQTGRWSAQYPRPLPVADDAP